MDTTILIKRIDELSSKLGISRNQALINAGVGKDFISNIIRKSSMPSTDRVLKVANYFNVSTDYLLGNEQKQTSLSDKDRLITEINTELYSMDIDTLKSFKNMLVAFARSKGK